MIDTNIDRRSIAGVLLAALTGAAALLAASALTAGAGAAASGHGAGPAHGKPTVVLVHGAFADGTGWQRVIPLLERDGYNVIAVQNPLTSLAVDVATTKRVIDAQPGAVVAVGHSYGGAVITGAAAGNSKVKALVYIAAFAPEAGEPVGAFLEKYPTALGAALRPDSAGFLTVERGRFRDLFAQDVPVVEARVMAAAQKPVIGDAFGASVPEAAWKTIPSRYMIARSDRAISPDLQRFYARRMGARASEIDSSHVPFVSRPAEVARLIDQAARAAAE